MKIVELINKIANDEEVPGNIKYQGYAWEWTGDDYKTFKYGEEKFLLSGREYNWVTEFLNDEVEIIEEEKDIKPLAKLGNYKVVNTGDDFLDKVLTNINERINHLIDKQTEIIDTLNEIRKEK